MDKIFIWDLNGSRNQSACIQGIIIHNFFCEHSGSKKLLIMSSSGLSTIFINSYRKVYLATDHLYIFFLLRLSMQKSYMFVIILRKNGKPP